MATVIRIKRRHDEEPTENIVVKAKRSRTDMVAEADSSVTHTIMMRVGTLETKEENVEPHVLKVIKEHKKSWELREMYKKVGSSKDIRASCKQQVKDRSTSQRYKIIEACRGISEDQSEQKEEDLSKKGAEQKDSGEADKTQETPEEDKESEIFKLYDAVTEAKMEQDVITCNGIPMETEKYVYDLYYAPQTVNWMEDICEIERHQVELYAGSDSDASDKLGEDDDENDESNWRNDYPDESDDSQYSDEVDYLNAQIRKVTTRQYETDESYDLDDYDEDFDEEGNLVQEGYLHTSINLRKVVRDLKISDDSDTD